MQKIGLFEQSVIQVKKPANFRLRAFVFWLPDLDSNQGPAD